MQNKRKHKYTTHKTKCTQEHNNMAAKQSTIFGTLAKATTY